MIADATLPETLVGRQASTRPARSPILTSDDLVNIETGLAVRDLLGDRWRDVPVVLRVFDRQARRHGRGQLRLPPRPLHRRRWRRPWFVGAALGLDVLQTLYVAGLPMLVARLTVEHSLAGTPMQQLPARLRVVRLQRAEGGSVDLPRRDEVLGRGRPSSPSSAPTRSCSGCCATSEGRLRCRKACWGDGRRSRETLGAKLAEIEAAARDDGGAAERAEQHLLRQARRRRHPDGGRPALAGRRRRPAAGHRDRRTTGSGEAGRGQLRPV